MKVIKVTEPADLQQAFAIREEVFVEEQQVAREDEYDRYEEVAHHFLAFYEGTPCGTARWRFTNRGIKLERFAVLKDFRDKKVGAAILKAILEDIVATPATEGKEIYLHAQIQVVDFYAKAGFHKVGDIFEECNIQHYTMVKKPTND
ncbi:MAG: GNAT family N-acetyltransferase [Thermonemataceae bacterium]